jgi:tetratricopeptide (TPR) repeat protein
MMSLSKLSLAAAVLALAVPAGAQDWRGGQGRLEGKVLDAEGKPVEGASVKLELPGRGGTTLKTNKKGQWAILGLAAGEWAIDIEAPGFTLKKITVPLPSESARIPPVEVKLEKAVAAGPAPEIMNALKNADAAYEAGRYSEARVEYEKALADPKIAAQPQAVKALHLRIARALSQEGNIDKEMEHLQAVLDADPGDANVLNIMAQESIKAGKVEKGMELLNKLDQSAIKDPAIFFNVGVMLLNQQKPENAIEYFTKTVALDPNYTDGYFQRALTYLQLQKLPESKADFKKVLELQPEGPQAETAKKALEQLPK